VHTLISARKSNASILDRDWDDVARPLVCTAQAHNIGFLNPSRQSGRAVSPQFAGMHLYHLFCPRIIHPKPIMLIQHVLRRAQLT
jgi:hypothetical protein